jgi:predicted kinase
MSNPILIVFGGLPGVGKTVIAGELARQIGATYVRIDSIEQAIRDSGALTGPMDDRGYRVAYETAKEKLRLGNVVVADSVNPLQLTRDAWIEVARPAGVPAIEIEIICSDAAEHRRRVEIRQADIPGLRLPHMGRRAEARV